MSAELARDWFDFLRELVHSGRSPRLFKKKFCKPSLPSLHMRDDSLAPCAKPSFRWTSISRVGLMAFLR
ncbi:unnamed protein product [Euphydryas editha]|uniref:PH domain-containing protein n=1 Tax=Euphydryas editha TaxID=104508 RepID=A0AAU9TD73_EUPED|nr:unnamed protein product [Euphydryas editha]